MTTDFIEPGPFEALGLLSGADSQAIERRADALAALLKLGLGPPEGDAVALEAGFVPRTPRGRDRGGPRAPRSQRWLREALLWPDCTTLGSALTVAADLLEAAAGRPTEPAGLVRHLALEYVSDIVRRAPRATEPDEQFDKLLTPPAVPPLYVGPAVPGRATDRPDGSNDH